MKIAKVALPVPMFGLFDYLCPKDLEQIGVRVAVPFGRQKKVGIIVSFSENSEIPANKLRAIDKVLDEKPIFNDDIWQLLIWACNYYHSPLGEAFNLALPVKLSTEHSLELPKEEFFTLTEKGKELYLSNQIKSQHQKSIIQQCFEKEYFLKITGVSQAWNALIAKGLIEKAEITENLAKPLTINLNDKLTLNTEQAKSLEQLVNNEGFNTFLLDGVTGSGKTEVYLQFIERILTAGKQVLVLVPEIGLTPQTFKRFQNRFSCNIATWHSNLTSKEKLATFNQVKAGKIHIIIGTRSAVFCQFANLGAIIIDEEQDHSFKNKEGAFKYHARDLALMRAKILNIPILLGSATPSFESLKNVQIDKFIGLYLKNRVAKANTVKTTILDLKGQKLQGGLDHRVLIKIKNELKQDNQVLIFLNRRGFAPALMCSKCSWLSKCPSCDKTFTYHKKNHKLCCHLCDLIFEPPKICPKCNSSEIISLGVGTEQLEQVLKANFPNTNITRIDRDSTALKGELFEYLKDAVSGKSQILIGTQMLSKGHHFPKVTLVVIVNIDNALYAQDFRASEQLAQTVIQVAGRAGREDKAGQMILQTHFANNPIIQTIAKLDYAVFAKNELDYRKSLNLPPYTFHICLRASSQVEQNAIKLLQKISTQFSVFIKEKKLPEVIIWPVIPAQIAKKSNFYRYILVLEHSKRAVLQQLLECFALNHKTLLKNFNGRFSIDVDPLDFS